MILFRPDQVCGVIDAFVNGLKMAALGFERAVAADTGRPAMIYAIYRGCICMAT
jgi:hypothetical protein